MKKLLMILFVVFISCGSSWAEGGDLDCSDPQDYWEDKGRVYGIIGTDGDLYDCLHHYYLDALNWTYCGCYPEGTMPLDDDNDGVFNYEDMCENTFNGETVDSNGCSISQVDSDGDGIDDSNDMCPGTERNIPVDSYGCIDFSNNQFCDVYTSTNTSFIYGNDDFNEKRRESCYADYGVYRVYVYYTIETHRGDVIQFGDRNLCSASSIPSWWEWYNGQPHNRIQLENDIRARYRSGNVYDPETNTNIPVYVEICGGNKFLKKTYDSRNTAINPGTGEPGDNSGGGGDFPAEEYDEEAKGWIDKLTNWDPTESYKDINGEFTEEETAAIEEETEDLKLKNQTWFTEFVNDNPWKQALDKSGVKIVNSKCSVTFDMTPYFGNPTINLCGFENEFKQFGNLILALSGIMSVMVISGAKKNV